MHNYHEDLNYIKVLTGYLIDKSIAIYKLRQRYINRINEYCEKIYKDDNKSA